MEPDPSPYPTGESEEDRVEGFEYSKMGRDIGESIISQIYDNSVSFVLEHSNHWMELDKEIKLKEEAVKKQILEVKMKEEELVKVVEQREKQVELREVSINERLGVLEEKENGFDKEVNLKEEALKEQTLELKMKKEELMKAVEEREKKVELREESITQRLGVLEEKEKDFDLKQIQEAEVIRLVLEKQNEEVVSQHKAQEKLLQDSMKKKHEEVMRELEAVKEEVGLISKSVDEKSSELERTVKEFDMKQVLVTESRRKEAELMEIARNNLETRENELTKTTNTRLSELKKKKEEFELRQREESRKIEEKSMFLELKEMKLDEKETKLALKKKKIKERVEKAMARKRSRPDVGTSSIAGNGRDASAGKRHKPVRENNHNGEERVCEVRGKARYNPASERKVKAKRREVEEIICIDSDDEGDPEPFTCPDPEFHCFTKTMESFSVGQVWALYEPLHLMPRYYAVIKRILKSELSLRVKWLEPEENTRNEYTIACGDFKYEKPDTQSYMAFSHEMQYIKQGKNVTIYPRKGETWALFSDWNKNRNSHRKRGKSAYECKFVEIMSEFDSHRGIEVASLENVEGFTSVYQRAEQHPLSQILISSDEMNRFSHSVPSFKLTGAESKGVPPGSFELDPAAIPQSLSES